MMKPQPKTINLHPVASRLRRRRSLKALVLELAPSALAVLVLAVILGGKNLSAEAPASQATKPGQQRVAAKPAQPAPEAIVEQPPTSQTSISPADRPPNPAKVSWDNRGLEIEASNSSLEQILRLVATDTGARLEGFTQDQRVFGSYGPGPGSEVLLKLLDGSGYNVLILGGRDTGAPLEIVLSARLPASPPAQNNQNRSNSKQLVPPPQPQRDYSAEPPQPKQNQNPFANGEPAHDPQQFMQEILQRQQKIDEQQQQNQQNKQQ